MQTPRDTLPSGPDGHATGLAGVPRGLTRRSRRAGVEIGEHSITLAVFRGTPRRPGAGRVHTSSLDPPNENGDWPGLREAFLELANTLCGEVGELAIALRRPICQVKALTLPRLNTRELERLLNRSASRFFSLPSGPVLTGFHRLGATDPNLTRVLAVAAPVALVDTVVHCAEAAGFRVGGITAAPIALAAGVFALEPRLRTGTTGLASVRRDALEILFADRGRLQLERSLPMRVVRNHSERTSEPTGANGVLPVDRDLAERISGILAEGESFFQIRSDRLLVLAPIEEDAQPCLSNLSVVIPTTDRTRELGPDALAALGAGLVPLHAARLVPIGRRAAARAHDRRRATLRLALAALILCATAGLHLAGLRREAAAVEKQRATLRPLVGEVLRARGAVHGVEERLSTLDSLAANRTRWPAVLATIADVLPLDSHLVGLQADSGRVRLEIRARSAAAVVAAFEQSSRFQEVRLSAPVRREEGSRGSMERLVVVTRSLPRPGAGGSTNGSTALGPAERAQSVPADTLQNPERAL